MAITTVQIPLANGVYKNVNQEELSDRDARLIDCYVDELGYTRKRPGLTLFKDISSTLGVSHYPVNGVFWWPHKSASLVVAYGKVLKVTYASGYITVTDLTGDKLSLNAVPTFTTDGTSAYFANGGKIVSTNGTAATAFMADGDAPTVVTHVDWLDGYLLAAGDGTNKFYWSDVNASTAWTALSFASAAGNPDIINALKVFERQIFLFGTSTFEVWQNDGETPFLRIPGGFYNIGCAAPNSIVTTDQTIYWLSDTRRIVRFANGQISVVSTPYDKDIAVYSSVSDCSAYRSVIDGRTFLIFNFPAANKTLVFSESDNKWCEWSYWSTSTAERSSWLGSCCSWSPVWGIHLVGDRTTGKLYIMSQDVYDDNATPIRMEKRTGFLDYGTRKNKRSEEIRVRAKRGVGGISRDPKLMIRWNTDGSKWSNEHHLSLGNVGETDIVMVLKRNGIFRAKQYEIVVTDAVPVAVGDGEEDITVLR